MLADSGTNGYRTVPSVECCSVCNGPLDDADVLVVKCYPEAGCSPPSLSAADGLLAVCHRCAVDVDELVSAWNGHEDPAVSEPHSISAGYRHVTDDCSFCGRALGDRSLLGIEYYRCGQANDSSASDGPESYANYSLCSGCVPVFDTFLEQVR